VLAHSKVEESGQEENDYSDADFERDEGVVELPLCHVGAQRQSRGRAEDVAKADEDANHPERPHCERRGRLVSKDGMREVEDDDHHENADNPRGHRDGELGVPVVQEVDDRAHEDSERQ
jgi:hypothetical protein